MIIRTENVKAFFWICHLLLLFYTYVFGGLVYLAKEAATPSEFVTCYINIFIVVLILSNCWWWVTARPLLKTVLALTEKSGQRVNKSERIRATYEKYIAKIKSIVLIFYGVMYMSEALIYLPKRINITLEFATMPCVGMEPLTSSPNREICLVILAATEFSIIISLLNYQALLLLLIAHTAAMYQLLSVEMMELNHAHGKDNEDIDESFSTDDFIERRIKDFIERHCLILELTQNIRELYSMPIGVNFASSAMCIMLFFFLPIEEYIKFIPVLLYCTLVFFLYCFLCQRLINASEEFEMAVYSCGWEKFNLANKQKIYNMLVQAQKPVELLAAYIVPVNIATFASTCQGMYKFVTVVKI